MVHKWNSIRDIKQKLLSSLNKPVNNLHIFFSTSPYELRDDVFLHDLGIDKSGYIFHLVFDKEDTDVSVIPTQSLSFDSSTNDIISVVKSGFMKHRLPTATDSFDGTGGVYFLREANGSYCAVFKPHDEEQGMPNNPKNHSGHGICGLRENFQPGQGCLRELAAYLMDKNHFCRVPSTALVHCEHPSFHYPLDEKKNPKLFPKFGSMQEYVAGAEPFDDIGPNLLSDIEVQKIALFDIRLLNCDRNAANILVRRSSSCSSMSPRDSYKLIPIDHGYCIPPKLKIYEWDWAWYNYPQVSRPVCPEILTYIRSIDIDQLIQKVSDHVMLTDDCQYLLRLSHFLLINALEEGMTLKEIATVICRTGDKEEIPSQLEKIISEAEENAYRVIEMTSHDSHEISIKDRLTPRANSISPNVEYSPLRRRSNSSLSYNNLASMCEFPKPTLQCHHSADHEIGSRKQYRSSSEDNTLYSKRGPGKLPSPKRKSRQCFFPGPPCPPTKERGVSLLSTDSECMSYLSTSSADPLGNPSSVSVDSHSSNVSSMDCSDLIFPKNTIICPNPKHGSSSLQKLFPCDSLDLCSSPIPSINGKPASPLSPTTILSSFQRPMKVSSSDEITDIQIESQIDSSKTDQSRNDDEILLEDNFFPTQDPLQESQDYGFFTQPLQDSHPSLTPSSLFDVFLPEPIPLSRVASFCGFESSPLCSHESTPIMNGTTRIEKRRAISETEQFKKLREEYSELFILSYLRRTSVTPK